MASNVTILSAALYSKYKKHEDGCDSFKALSKMRKDMMWTTGRLHIQEARAASATEVGKRAEKNQVSAELQNCSPSDLSNQTWFVAHVYGMHAAETIDSEIVTFLKGSGGTPNDATKALLDNALAIKAGGERVLAVGMSDPLWNGDPRKKDLANQEQRSFKKLRYFQFS